MAVNEGGGKCGQLPDLLSKHREERSGKSIISTSVPVGRPKFRGFFLSPYGRPQLFSYLVLL